MYRYSWLVPSISYWKNRQNHHPWQLQIAPIPVPNSPHQQHPRHWPVSVTLIILYVTNGRFHIAEQATFSLARLCNNPAVPSVNSGFCGAPRVGNFSPVQNQPYCCDAPLEGNAKPPAKLDDVGILMEFQTSWAIFTYTYHINQPDKRRIYFFPPSNCRAFPLVVVPWWWNASMVPPLKAIGPHAALQPMSFPNPVHQCFSASVGPSSRHDMCFNIPKKSWARIFYW